MICDPPAPEMSALPGTSLPSTVRGTYISREVRAALRSMTPKEAMMSAAPFSGRFTRVFSPVTRTDPGPIWDMIGIIILVRRPDSPQ